MDLQNGAGTRIQNQHKIDTAGSGSVHAKENAATSAKVNGVNSDKKARHFRANVTPKRGANAMSKWAASAHKSACRMLGYVLTLDTPDAWHGLALVLRARLTRNQRAALAYAALRTLTEDEARLTVEAVNAGRTRQQVAA